MPIQLKSLDQSEARRGQADQSEESEGCVVPGILLTHSALLRSGPWWLTMLMRRVGNGDVAQRRCFLSRAEPSSRRTGLILSVRSAWCLAHQSTLETVMQRSDSDFQAQPSRAANEHERSCLCDASERKSRRCYELQTKSMIQQHFMLQCGQFWAFDEHLIHIKEFTHCIVLKQMARSEKSK